MATEKSGKQHRPSNEPTPKRQNPDYRRGMAALGKDKGVDAGQKTGMRGPQG